ncbi:hypothetical protein OF820_05575 [Oceanotoga sp. DSM 15011]|jgi:N-methylhydantoinase A/oxoprolinase/acetone carboxylase beta subunit|uniref:hydantoinase/oxoprolinase family protein n=1 Tax=Oceanotoga sp. DSM 15011 TaxID=2984951 RepID=UPI0021F4BDAE|nr:hydantoinase/oxoprolinase family protein [Oceanotoga sp. DSM 15011]UYP01154.1 hypothetical protein OF820_05575 [Oceanotoga sp. DSM 15011]
MGRRYRVGIDVGGTFTDAALIDESTYSVISTKKIPTTHSAKEGVANGIVKIIESIITENNIYPEEIVFIAHGTTQATNALLEGDVSDVGVIGIGTGIEGTKTQSETNVGRIELAKGKFLNTHYEFIDSKFLHDGSLKNVFEKFKQKNINTIISAEAYSVDNPFNEDFIIEEAEKNGMTGTASHEISKLYGLKTRTRTAVINGSIISRMMETANMTEDSVKKSGIKSPLMIMRCDGGVMTIDEVRKRPILTMLSGPAAGVAGALMYEKISDGIFFEIGGTSTDISVIKNGKVMIKYAEIGGHKTYLNSLDVRTIGIAGGSMIKIENNKIVDVGPRSAHIAELDYETFVDDGEIEDPVVKYINPKESDEKNYAILETKSGKKYSYTLAGAANLIGMIPVGDYARGNIKETKKAYEALAKELNTSVEDVLETIMNIACSKVLKVVNEMKADYDLSESIITLVGGGGSASVIVPYLAKKTNYKYKIAKNAPYISTIGVALAMVREVVERTVANPTNDDIKNIRKEAKIAAMNSGANEKTIEIIVEIDSKKNIIRAIASGTTELRTKDLSNKILNKNELEDICLKSVKECEKSICIAETEKYSVYELEIIVKKFFGLIKKKYFPIRVIDNEGVIRLQKDSGFVYPTSKKTFKENLLNAIQENTKYGDAGEELPFVYILAAHRIIDLAGLANKEQIISIAEIELDEFEDEQELIILISK